MRIAVIDSGSSNLNSVKQALLRIGGDLKIEISSDAAVLEKADKLIFPGVGAISGVMSGLQRNKLVEFVKNTKKPLLGICLGMQILYERSEEIPLHSAMEETLGLGIIKGTVTKLDASNLPLPHMGWNSLDTSDHPLFTGLSPGVFVYFVHSYCAPVTSDTIAVCEYGVKFTAAVAKDNFYGVQFHPEKSGPVGAQILRNFVELL